MEYGLSSVYAASSALDSNLTTSHSVTLSSLAANTIYHYRVISTDVSGNTATSSDQTFVTQADSSSGDHQVVVALHRSSSSEEAVWLCQLPYSSSCPRTWTRNHTHDVCSQSCSTGTRRGCKNFAAVPYC